MLRLSIPSLLLTLVLLSSTSSLVFSAELHFNTSATLCDDYNNPCNLSDPRIWIDYSPFTINDTLIINNTVGSIYIVVRDTVEIYRIVIDILQGYLLVDGGNLKLLNGGIEDDNDDEYSVIINSNITIRNAAVMVAGGLVFLGDHISVHDTSTLLINDLIDLEDEDYQVIRYVETTIVLHDNASFYAYSVDKHIRSFILHNSSKFNWVGDAWYSQCLLTNVVVRDSAEIVIGGSSQLVIEFNNTLLYYSSVRPSWPQVVFNRNMYIELWSGLDTQFTTFPSANILMNGDFTSFCGYRLLGQTVWANLTLQNGNSQLAYGYGTSACSQPLQNINFFIENSAVAVGNLTGNNLVPMDESSVIIRNSTLSGNIILSNIDLDENSVLVANNIHFTNDDDGITTNGVLILPDDGVIRVSENEVQFTHCVWGHGRVFIADGGVTCEDFLHDPTSDHNSIVNLTIHEGYFSTWNTAPIRLHVLDIANDVIINTINAQNFTVTTSLVLRNPSHLELYGDLHLSNASFVFESLATQSDSELLYVNGTLFLTEGEKLTIQYNSAQVYDGSKYVIARATNGVVGRFTRNEGVESSTPPFTIEYSENEISIVFPPANKPPGVVWWVWVLVAVAGVVVISVFGYILVRCFGRRNYQTVG